VNGYHFPQQLLDQSRKLHFPPGRANRPINILKQRGIHHSHAIYPKPQVKPRSILAPSAPPWTGWADVHVPPGGLEQPPVSSGNTASRPESGAESGAHPDGFAPDHNTEGERINQDEVAQGASTADQGDPLAKLAAALLRLSPADRQRLAAMLTPAGGEAGEKRP
jgi:hypothetical protein